jgi:hypothetical protein
MARISIITPPNTTPRFSSWIPNGSNNPSPGNPLAAYYAPLQQLFTDFETNKVARYHRITPDQYNDMQFHPH